MQFPPQRTGTCTVTVGTGRRSSAETVPRSWTSHSEVTITIAGLRAREQQRAVDDERSRWRCTLSARTSPSGTVGGWSVKPCHAGTCTPILKSIRWRTGSQWRSRNVGLIMVMASFLYSYVVIDLGVNRKLVCDFH